MLEGSWAPEAWRSRHEGEKRVNEIIMTLICT